MNVLFIFQNSFHEPLGVMALGDPLGPLFFALVLRKITAAIDTDADCLALLFNAWFLDDGVLAGKKSAILRAVSLIGTLGPPLGLHINLSKCELFSHTMTHVPIRYEGAPPGHPWCPNW